MEGDAPARTINGHLCGLSAPLLGSALVASRQLVGFTRYVRGNIRVHIKQKALAMDDVAELVVNHKRPLLP